MNISITPFEYIVYVFALYRLAHLAVEDGPFGIIKTIQDRIDHNDSDTWYGRGIRCPLCVGFWVAWVVAFFAPWQTGTEYAVLALSLAGLSTALEMYIGR